MSDPVLTKNEMISSLLLGCVFGGIMVAFMEALGVLK